jgi:hypothetical protein
MILVYIHGLAWPRFGRHLGLRGLRLMIVNNRINCIKVETFVGSVEAVSGPHYLGC